MGAVSSNFTNLKAATNESRRLYDGYTCILGNIPVRYYSLMFGELVGLKHFCPPLVILNLSFRTLHPSIPKSSSLETTDTLPKLYGRKNVET